MEWYELLGVLLGSSVLVAVVNLITDRLKRRDTIEDKRDKTSGSIERILKMLNTDKARLDAHEEQLHANSRQLAALEAKQTEMVLSLHDLHEGQVVVVRSIMALLDATPEGSTSEARHAINEFLCGKLGQ